MPYYTERHGMRSPIIKTYHTWIERGFLQKNELPEKTIYIERKNTGKTVTKTFTFDDICLGNMEILRSDFRIGSVGTAAEVLSVEVSTPN